MRFQLVQVLVIRKELCKILRTAECIQIDEDRIALDFTRILDTQVIWICKHGHDLLLHICFRIRKVDAVSKRFAHLCLSIDTRQTQTCLVGRKQDLRFRQSLAVHAVEFVDDLLALL